MAKGNNQTTNMQIKIANDSQKWDEWQKQYSKYNKFTQSWNWGDILLSEGHNVQKLEVMENDTIIAQALVIIKKYPLGISYAFCPKGPIIKESVDQLSIFKAIKQYLKSQNISFIRIEPPSLNNIEDTVLSIDINPKATILLDLNNTTEDLLKQMKPKTRYNIRLSQKKDITVNEQKNVDEFYKLSNKTSTRDGFSLHPKKHYEKIIQSDFCFQFNAVYENKIIASIVCIGFGNTFTYLFGASDYNFRTMMAPHLLQYFAIQKAKELEYKYYDFFGIAPKSEQTESYSYDSNHQYAGVTRFKIGFGGKIIQDPGTYDIIISSFKYKLYKFLRKIRRR